MKLQRFIFLFFIKCTVVQFHVLHLENIFLSSVSLCVVFVWKIIKSALLMLYKI